jgi:hypothetical protein
MTLPNSCEVCYFWDQEALHVDLIEELEKIPPALEHYGYCRLHPPAPGLSEYPWDSRVVQRGKDWCASYREASAGLTQFMEKHPELTPVIPEGEE